MSSGLGSSIEVLTNVIAGDGDDVEYTEGKVGGAIIDKVLPGPNPDMSPQVQECVHIVNETIKNIVEDKSKKIVKDH